ALYPLSVVLIERVFFNSKKINPITLIGLLLGITGVAFIFYEKLNVVANDKMFFGLGLSIFAMLSWSLGTVFIARNKTNINPYYGIGWQMLVSSVILFLISLISKQTIPLSGITWSAWIVIFYLVVFGSIISFIAFIHSMKGLPPSISSLYAYANPIVAIVLGALILHEELTVSMIWGTMVTLSGVFLVNYSVRKDQQKIIVESEL
ncbi:MAG: drug/metabolite-transporting permease, partial [Ferruginibacter sp.]|nr:drug/metabolite-transporting permease [Ferruginibacter sp.]